MLRIAALAPLLVLEALTAGASVVKLEGPGIGSRLRRIGDHLYGKPRTVRPLRAA